MLQAILSDLRSQLPEIFEHSTEDAILEAIKAYVDIYQSTRALPIGAKDDGYTKLFKKIVKANVKLPRKPMPKRDRLSYAAPLEKKCTKCFQVKLIAQFNKDTNKRHLAMCAKCQYELYQRPANVRRLRELGKKPRAEMSKISPEEKILKNRAAVSRWSKQNREKRSAAERARRVLKNPPKPKAEKPVKTPRIALTSDERKAKRKEQGRIYRQKNQDKIASERLRYKEKHKACPHRKVAKNLRKRLKELLEPGTKIGSFSGMTGCAKGELMTHIEGSFLENMSWDNYGEWHIDHIRPMASFDLANPQARKEVNHFTNLQAMWKSENEIKGSLWEGVRYSKGKPVTD